MYHDPDTRLGAKQRIIMTVMNKWLVYLIFTPILQGRRGLSHFTEWDTEDRQSWVVCSTSPSVESTSICVQSPHIPHSHTPHGQKELRSTERFSEVLRIWKKEIGCAFWRLSNVHKGRKNTNDPHLYTTQLHPLSYTSFCFTYIWLELCHYPTPIQPF